MGRGGRKVLRMALRLLGGGVVAGGTWLAYVGHKARKERQRLNVHENLIDLFLGTHPELKHQRYAVDWTAPRMPDYDLQEGGFSHLYFDLSIDAFSQSGDENARAGNDKTSSKETGAVGRDLGAQHVREPVLLVAPPSFVSSRSIFFPLAMSSFSNFAITEVPSYGLNKQDLRAEHYKPEIFDSGLATLVARYSEVVRGDVEKPAQPRTPTQQQPQKQQQQEQEQQQQQQQQQQQSGRGIAVVAAGHAGITALRVAQQHPELFSCLILLNPTFRGPLPTARFDLQAQGNKTGAKIMDYAMGGIWKLYQLSYLGDAVHDLFTSRSNIEHQLRSHVFEQEESINEAAVTRNQAFAKEGPILAKCAFLVGKADPLSSREELQQLLAGGCRVPTLVVMGYGGPETSRADLQPLRDSADKGDTNIKVVETRGALRSYEEFPDEIGAVIKSFIDTIR